MLSMPEMRRKKKPGLIRFILLRITLLSETKNTMLDLLTKFTQPNQDAERRIGRGKGWLVLKICTTLLQNIQSYL